MPVLMITLYHVEGASEDWTGALLLLACEKCLGARRRPVSEIGLLGWQLILQLKSQ